MHKTKNNPKLYLSRSKLGSDRIVAPEVKNPSDSGANKRDFEQAHIDASFYFTFSKKGKV